ATASLQWNGPPNSWDSDRGPLEGIPSSTSYPTCESSGIQGEWTRGSVRSYFRPVRCTDDHLRFLRLGGREPMVRRDGRHPVVPRGCWRDERCLVLRLGPNRPMVVQSEARHGGGSTRP